MAVMWPKRLPNYILQDHRRSSEVQVFNELNRTLDDSWHVYYSRPWWGLTATGGEAEGEADFIIVHAELGVMFLEVKGGAIAWDSSADQWYSTDRNGIRHKIKDPVAQASVCKHQFLARFRKAAEWPKSFVNARHAVLFPHTVQPAGDYIGKYNIELFGFEREFKSDLGSWVGHRLGLHAGETLRKNSLGRAGVDVIHAAIAQDVQLSFGMTSLIDAELQETEALLTGTQVIYLRAIESNIRTIVEGPAGTGKTLLAAAWLEKVASLDASALYVTKNRNLLEHFRRIAARMPDIKALTLADFLSAVNSDSTGPDRHVVVDELQDLDHTEINSLQQYLAAHKVHFLGLMDSNQAIYANPRAIAERLDAEVMLLDINLRNSKKIGQVAEALYSGPNALLAGPDGKAIGISATDGVDSTEILVDLLNQLKSQGVPENYITILCSTEEVRDGLQRKLVQVIPGLDRYGNAGGGVTLEAVGGFKGLESPVVIILSDKKLAQSRELSYVAVSRARGMLYVIGKFAHSVLEDALDQTDVVNF